MVGNKTWQQSYCAILDLFSKTENLTATSIWTRMNPTHPSSYLFIFACEIWKGPCLFCPSKNQRQQNLFNSHKIVKLGVKFYGGVIQLGLARNRNGIFQFCGCCQVFCVIADCGKKGLSRDIYLWTCRISIVTSWTSPVILLSKNNDIHFCCEWH